MLHEVTVALTSVNSMEEASRIAKVLIQQRLAACVQISGPVVAVYDWEDRLCEDKEWQLFIKLPVSGIENLKSWIVQEHPYEEPELLFLDIRNGSQSYLKWVIAQCEGGLGESF